MDKQSPEILAYTAGIVDGEGCIAVERTKDERCSNSGWDYRTIVVIVNTNILLIEWLRRNFGGYVQQRKPSCKKWKPCFTWQLTSKKAEEFLLKIFPFLILKKEQALVVFEFRQTYGPRKKFAQKVPNDTIIKREYLYWKLKQLNKKGPIR